MGSCLTLGSEVSEDTHVLTKQKTLLGRGAQAENSGMRELRRGFPPPGQRVPLPRGSQSQFLW